MHSSPNGIYEWNASTRNNCSTDMVLLQGKYTSSEAINYQLINAMKIMENYQ